MKIEYYTKSVYGNNLIYLADSKAALSWWKITGLRTITVAQMEELANLTGAEFARVFEPELPKVDEKGGFAR